MRMPFKKHINDIVMEDAHGGSGKRQIILSKSDPISSQMDAMTRGFLAQGAKFDWHEHENIDEFFLVLRGTGVIKFKDSAEIKYKKNDLIYIPANLSHQIQNTGTEENEFFFIRLNQ